MKRNFLLMMTLLMLIAGCVSEEKDSSVIRKPRGFSVKVKASKF